MRFLPELQARSKMNVYVEVLELNDVEGKALWEGMKFELKNYRESAEKIDKVALVTDLGWLKTLAKASYSLMPGIQSKTFGLDERDAGQLWVKE